MSTHADLQAGGTPVATSQTARTEAEALVLEALSCAATRGNVGTAVQLYHETMAAIDKLFEAAKGNQCPFADHVLAMLPQICTERALQIVTSTPGSSAQVQLTASLAHALTRSVHKFTQAANAYPVPFVRAARHRFEWPVLWVMRGNTEQLKEFAEGIQLGAGLGLKATGAINFQSAANTIVALAICALDKVRPLLKQGAPIVPLLPRLLEQLARIETEFPPLTQSPQSLRFWWTNGVKPLIESDKANLIASRDLENYRGAARKANKDTRYRAKADTLAWNRFLTDCRKALKRLAPPVTDEAKKTP